jgi:hypothetical protein
MKKWIWKLLGLDLLQANNTSLLNQVNHLRRDLQSANMGIGRILAKIDPLYGTPEDDPSRRTASNQLAEDTIKRLKGEDQARKAMTGEA